MHFNPHRADTPRFFSQVLAANSFMLPISELRSQETMLLAAENQIFRAANSSSISRDISFKDKMMVT